jgi:hypothetical protein
MPGRVRPLPPKGACRTAIRPRLLQDPALGASDLARLTRINAAGPWSVRMKMGTL